MPAPAVKPSFDGWRFRWDVVLFLAFALAAMRHWTDLPLHELLGAAVMPVLAVHLWLNWSWIVDVLRRPAATLRGEARFNRAWDIAQSAVAFIALGSGLLASRYLFPMRGLPRHVKNLMEDVHAGTAWALMVMIGVHLGVHLPWLGAKLRKPRFAVFAILLTLAIGAATQLPLFHEVNAFGPRTNRDGTRVALAWVPAALLAFGILMVRRRRRAKSDR